VIAFDVFPSSVGSCSLSLAVVIAASVGAISLIVTMVVTVVITSVLFYKTLACYVKKIVPQFKVMKTFHISNFFSVAILLSLYYLFLWDPYIKSIQVSILQNFFFFVANVIS
jgi:hypothetical protein